MVNMKEDMATQANRARAALEELNDFLSQWANWNSADLIDEEAINGLIAESNALGWHFDDVELLSAAPRPDAVRVTANVWFCGEQDTDKPPCGDHILARMTFDVDSEGWVVPRVLAAVMDDDLRDEAEPLREQIETALQR